VDTRQICLPPLSPPTSVFVLSRSACGVLSRFSSVRFDDSTVSFPENGQTIDALMVKDKTTKGREWLIFCDLSRALPAPDRIARKTHDFSALTSDSRVSERLCLLFDQAVKSRESVSHYRTVGAVCECLKSEAFCILRARGFMWMHWLCSLVAFMASTN
jgi:hypothetical protein